MSKWMVVQVMPCGKPFYEVWSGEEAEQLARQSMADVLCEDAHRGDGELKCQLVELTEYADNHYCGG